LVLQANELDIYNSIKEAIIEQKLRPNMQLVEEVISEAFGVSRTPVRNVFRRLASERLVTITPYKGTFIACPTIEEAIEVFEMRRLLEAAAIRKLCKLVENGQHKQLSSVVEEELLALKEGDVIEGLNLSGDFHLKIAELAGGIYYSKFLKELISLTYVIIALYGDKNYTNCHDHENILAAIQQGDADLAERLLIDHLIAIEKALNFQEAAAVPSSLAEIFPAKMK